jgi:type II secretory pathway component GspD/PulD (secretin)
MKTSILTILTAICASGLLLSASAQTDNNNNNNTAAPPDQAASPPADNGNAAAPDQGTAPDQAAPAPAPDQGAMDTQAVPVESGPITSTVILPNANAPRAQSTQLGFTPPAKPLGNGQNDLQLNFVNAPLDEVLNYLSDAAGFIIVMETRVSGSVTVRGSHVTKDEAVNLVNTELNKNGYAAIRDDRTLTIMSKNVAIHGNIPVIQGNNPTNIPVSDEMVTQIIPIRFVEARQLVSDLSSFVSPDATVVANEAGNSIIITDTQANIRHLVQVIKAVDDSAEAETEVKVFPLKYASPTDVANELSAIFPSSNNNGAQSPIQFAGAGGRGGARGGGGFGGGRGGGFGGGNPFAALFGGGAAANPSAQRIQKAQQVNAVADARIQAVVVTAPNDLMDEIASMMSELDVPSQRDQKVYVYHLDHGGDPYQVAQALQSSFGGNNRAQTSQQSALTLRQTAGAQQAATQQSQNSTLGGSSSGGRSGGTTLP